MKVCLFKMETTKLREINENKKMKKVKTMSTLEEC